MHLVPYHFAAATSGMFVLPQSLHYEFYVSTSEVLRCAWGEDVQVPALPGLKIDGYIYIYCIYVCIIIYFL